MRWPLFALAFLPLTSCLFPSLGGLSDDADARGDAASDQSAPAASDDFEQGCSGWETFYGTLTPTTIAHSGTGACMVCLTQSGSFFTADHSYAPFVPAQAGDTFSASIWIRVAPQTTNTSLEGVIVLRAVQGQSYVEQSLFDSVPIGQAWQQVSTTMTLDGGVGVSGYVGTIDYKTGDCFIIDDFALVKD